MGISATDVLERLAGASERLQSRRYVKFALTGPSTTDIITEVQGRGWGSESTWSLTEIQDLISSIGTVGLLQPIQLERQPDGRHLLVAGERRLRAMRWGSIHHPDNPHFASVAAVVVDGPLTEEEKRRWQLIENLARQDLKPGELAAAMLYERSALLAEKLQRRGVDPSAAMGLDDAVQRWEAISRIRLVAELHSVGVGWAELIQHLGLSLSPGRAEQLVRAFRAMPEDVSSTMDANDVSLASRQEWLRLARGRREAADEIWAALQVRGRTDLLTRSCKEALAHPGAGVEEIIGVAEAVHDRVSDDGEAQPPDSEAVFSSAINVDVVVRTTAALEELLGELRAGGELEGYASGTLVLHARELLAHLDQRAAAA